MIKGRDNLLDKHRSHGCFFCQIGTNDSVLHDTFLLLTPFLIPTDP